MPALAEIHMAKGARAIMLQEAHSARLAEVRASDPFLVGRKRVSVPRSIEGRRRSRAPRASN
jgi:hypothetical protein